jgi:3-dehydroquinate synthase
VRLKERSYPIRIGRGSLATLPALLAGRGLGGRAVIVTDSYLRGRAAREVSLILCEAGWSASLIVLPRGELAKSFAVLERLYGSLISARVERGTPLLAVGGGTVGDCAGFAAATYFRGIPLVHVPTTLLAQVDSSIGGKTAVNHPLAKNAVGAFYQPVLVVCDPQILSSLPRRELLSGLAEAVKVALAFDPAFARWLLRHWDKLLACEPAALERVVRVCAAWKAKVVAQDERDLCGARQFLNFGHTLGHALESATFYRHFTHGEGVAWGMAAALALSQGRGWLTGGELSLAVALLGRLERPAPPKGLRWRAVLSGLRRDKKARDLRAVFILLRGLGRAEAVDDVTPAELRRAARLSGLALLGTNR